MVVGWKGKKHAEKLSVLIRREVGEAIQEGEHNSVDDARAALLVYRKHRSEWEKWIREKRKGKKEEVASGEGIVSWCVCWNERTV